MTFSFTNTPPITLARFLTHNAIQVPINHTRKYPSLNGRQCYAVSKRIQQDVSLLRGQQPCLHEWIATHPQRVIDYHGYWPGILEICAYFVEHPRPQCYIRELPVRVHTKFVEQHAGILRELLEILLYKRTYRCTRCGLVMDRDENSAYNMRDRYFVGLAAIICRYFARLGPHAPTAECGVPHDENDEVGVAGTSHFPVVQQLTLW